MYSVELLELPGGSWAAQCADLRLGCTARTREDALGLMVRHLLRNNGETTAPRPGFYHLPAPDDISRMH